MYSCCNPTTGQCAALPPLDQTREICSFSLAFDPLKSMKYKVICMVDQGDVEEPELGIVIYSSRNGNWRAYEARICLDSDIGIYSGVYCGGIHWITDSGPCFYFDLDEEQIKEMPMLIPLPDDWGRRRVRYFGESRGHLQIIEIYHPPSTQFDLWELRRDYSGWLLKYRVDLDGLVREYPGMISDYVDPLEVNYYVFEIFCIVEGETKEESFMVLHIPGNIVRYDFKTRNTKKLCDFSPSDDHRKDESAANFYSSYAYEYIESLVRL